MCLKNSHFPLFLIPKSQNGDVNFSAQSTNMIKVLVGQYPKKVTILTKSCNAGNIGLKA